MCHHKATSVAAYMFAICWFISFVFIFIYIYFGYSPKRTHMFPWNLSKIIKAFEEKMTNLNKEITTRSKTLEEVCSKFSCFLGCLGVASQQSESSTVCLCCPLRGKSTNPCTGEKFMRHPFVYVWQHRDVGLVGSKDVRVVFVQATLEIYPIGQWCALVSSSTVRTNMRIRHIRAFFFQKEVSVRIHNVWRSYQKHNFITILYSRNSHEKVLIIYHSLGDPITF